MMTNGRWTPAKRKYGVVVSSYAGDGAHGLAVHIGETVQMLEEYSEDGQTVLWYRGCVLSHKSKKGIFPASYVHPKACTVENEGPFETVVPGEDSVIKELTFVLREWQVRWKSLFVDGVKSLRHQLFQTIRLVMGELIKYRVILVNDTLTKDQALELKHQVVTIIDWGNSELGMDLVPRVDYRQADPEKVSVVELFRIHSRSVENCKGAWPGGKVAVTTESQGETVHHLLINLCSMACSIGEDSELYFSLYDNTEGRFLSEKFVMHFNKDGKRTSNDKYSNSTLFTDLSTEDIQKDLFLVLQILRKGRLTTEVSSKKVPTYQYRRPWGVAVLSLKEVFTREPEDETEHFLRVQCVDNETHFSTLHETLIKKQSVTTGKGGADKQIQAVTLSAKVMYGDLHSVKKENPSLFKGITFTQRMGFSDFFNPGEVRNDLYITIAGAEFDRGNKTASKNVEVRVSVFNQHYEMIQQCILSANGEHMSSNFFSYVFYHNNSPRWNETVRLSIPIETFNTAHIRLELCHCSNRDKAEKKMYGFAFLSVITNGNVTRLDGKYNLAIYKCDDASKVKNYLRLPSLIDDFNDPKLIPTLPTIPYHRSPREYVTVETFLCSTKFAQKAELLNVLQWSSNPVDKIPSSLENLVTLRGQELVRYLQDILDALFAMYSSSSSGTERVPYAMDIFLALVYIFNLLQEDVFQKFSCVLEDYLEKNFSSPVAHRDMMYCLQKKVEMIYTCSNFDKQSSSKKVFKVLADILKFSVKSCLLSQSLIGSQLVTEFRENLNEVFKSFGKVLQSTGKELQKAQSQLLNSLHTTYIPLLHIVSKGELAQFVIFIINKISKEPGNSVLRAKTALIKNTINSVLMQDEASRMMLLPHMLDHLKKCLRNKWHMEITASTLGDLLSTIFSLRESCDIKEEVTQIIRGVFDVTVRALRTMSDKQRAEAQSLLISCLMEMLRLMDVSHYQKLISDHPKPKPLKSQVRLSTIVIVQQCSNVAMKDFLNRVLLVFRDLVSSQIFPSDWTTMKMITNTIMLTSIQYIADDLTVNFLQGSDFDRELWHNFFLLAVAFITQPALQLEKYSKAKSSQIKDRYYDMRVPVGCHIHALWNQLGSHKQHLLMELIGPFLKVTMVPEVELRKATIPIFFDIIECEFGLHKHMRRVEAKMIYELDFLILEHHGDVHFKKLFSSILLDKVQAEPEMQEEGKRFIFSVTDLLERLLDYREIMDREEQRDTKMHCTFNILNFYKDNRRDMYIRYISRLYELHYGAENFVEAGLTLRLYSQLLTWSDTRLQAEMSYSAQSEAERKEELCNRILHCFEVGKAWEYGIPICKELSKHYEETFQYKKLSQILQRHAALLSYILEGNEPNEVPRQDPTYYRVAYYGSTFPPYLKNKAFIYRMTYRGNKCPNLEDIMNQLLVEYPAATILPSSSPPDESYKLGEAQYIQITCVKPVPCQRPEFVGKQVPIKISSFYCSSEVDTFQFDRPYHRDNRDKNNEFKSLCLERTTLHSSYKLPGILPWYEVVKTEVVHLCPVQTATDTVQQMNAELRLSTDNAASNPEQHLQHLLMRLQGVISAAVNGGIAMYQEAFFNQEYLTKYPNEETYIDELKAGVLEQIQLLEQGLTVHGRYTSPEMRPLHDSLVEQFVKLRNSMGYRSTPAPNRSSSISTGSQRPSTPSSTSLNSSGSNRSSVVSAGEVPGIEEDTQVDTLECLLPSPNKSVSASNLATENRDPSPPPPQTPRKKSISHPDQDILAALSTSLKTIPPPIPNRTNLNRVSIMSDKLDRHPAQKLEAHGGFSEPTVIKEKPTGPAPPRPPRTPTATVYTTPGFGTPSKSPTAAIPPLPSKRNTTSPLNNSGYGGSLKNMSELTSGQLLKGPSPKSRMTFCVSSNNNNNVDGKSLGPPPPLKPKPPIPPMPSGARVEQPHSHRGVPPPPLPSVAEGLLLPPRRDHSSSPTQDTPPPVPERRPSSSSANS